MESLGISYITAPVPAEINSLPIDQLKELLECDELLEDFILDLPHVKSITEECYKLAEENVNAARQNAELSRQCEAVRDRTLQSAETLTTLNNSFQNLSVTNQQLSAKLQPHSIQENMDVAALQSEEQSEEVAEKFLDKQMGIDAFLKTYIDKRVESHTRKFKSERLKAQLIELQKAGF